MQIHSAGQGENGRNDSSDGGHKWAGKNRRYYNWSNMILNYPNRKTQWSVEFSLHVIIK
jgi:hypothetical protein